MRKTFRILLSVAAGVFALAIALLLALPLIADLLSPTMPRTVLTDGKRMVELQSMIHIAEPQFYDAIAAHVAERRAAGWLVFYEQIREDPAKGGDTMADMLGRMGVAWDPQSGKHPYVMISSLVGDGLVLQSNAHLLGSQGPDVRNIDITADELLAGMPQSIASEEKPPQSLDAMIREIDELPHWTKSRLQAGFRIALSARSRGLLAGDNPEIITVKREALVTDAILGEPQRNILVLYGAAHMPPIESRLKAADPAWRITDRTYSAPF